VRAAINRFFIGAAVLFAAAPAAEAQQAGKAARLGVLLFGTPAGDPNVTAFRQGHSERLARLAVAA